MISTARTALVTATELPALSSRLSIEGKRTELVRGDLVVMTPAGGRHGQVAHRVGLVIGNHVLDRNLGRVFAAETGFLLERNPDTARAPDVAFVAAERLGTGETPAGFLEMAPDLAVEVVSPTIPPPPFRPRSTTGWRPGPGSSGSSIRGPGRSPCIAPRALPPWSRKRARSTAHRCSRTSACAYVTCSPEVHPCS